MIWDFMTAIDLMPVSKLTDNRGALGNGGKACTSWQHSLKEDVCYKQNHEQ